MKELKEKLLYIKVKSRVFSTILIIAIFTMMFIESLLLRTTFVLLLCGIASIAWYLYFAPKTNNLAVALERSEKIQSVLEDSVVGTYIIQDNRLIYVNRRLSELLGYSREEIYQGDFLKKVVPPDFYEQALDNLQKRMDGESVDKSYSLPIIRRDQQRRLVKVFPKRVMIEGKVSVTGVVIDVTEQDQVAKQLEESEGRFRSLFDNSPDIVCSFDLEGNFLSANPSTEVITGRSIDDLLHQSFMPIIYSEDLAETMEHFEAVKKGDPQKYEVRLYHADGYIIPLEVTNFPMIVNGEMVGVYCIAKDISGQKEMLRLLKETQQKFDSLYNNTLDAIFEINAEGFYFSVNKVAEELTGYSKEQLLRLGIKDLIVADELKSAMDTFARVKNGEAHRIEHTLVHKNGQHIIIDINAVPVYQSDGSVNVITFIQDITNKKRIEEETKQLAFKDTLTELPNRYLFTKQLTEAIDHAKKNRSSLGVLFIDCDNFKAVNDTLGHDIGDLLLKQVASMMQSCLRKQDLIARQGGDEFLILLESVDEEDIRQISDRVIEKLNKPIYLAGHEMFITPSIGISVYPDYGHDAASLIKHADLAMYLAKEKGKNNYQFYTEHLNDRITRKHQLEHTMRKALENEEFTLFYQPQYDLKTKDMIGVEALLRWNPEFGFVSPAEFIPIAEETGLIVDIGKFVLREACVTSKRWKDLGFNDMPISVNVSARQIKQANFIETVVDILQETKLHPSYLELEITESVMLDVEEALVTINELKEMGIKIAIDDFGVGYSSLNVIKDIDIDALKIDQSFLHDVMSNPKSAGLLEAIIHMGRKVDANVIVEGIETEQQVNFLMPYDVIGQGYFYSRPLPVEELEKLIRQNG